MTSELRVGKSELTNLTRNDADDTRLKENLAILVKSISALTSDFEKQLAKIDTGIHGEVS